MTTTTKSAWSPSRFVSGVVIAAAIAAALSGAPEARAGNGNFRNNEYNFCVSVRFDATAAQLSAIQSAFQRGSQILADATDGQQRFGEITLVNDSGASDSAEYWVRSGGGRAYATIGRYGVRGEHVNLFMGSNFGAGPGAAYTVAHEHAHHAFGVLDEYSGPGFLGLGTRPAECAAGPDTAALDFCLMDNFFTRGGNAVGAGFTLDEFCVAGNHDPDGDTFQERRNGESCWETISSHPTRSAAAPGGLPVAAPPAAHTVSFVDGFGGLRVMLVLDRSGSMSIGNRLTFAKRGANTFLRFLETGDGVGVASFACDTRTDFPLTSITGSGTIAAATAAVNSLTASGTTNIGGGLQQGLNQLTAQTDRSCNEIIVLLSDGDHNCGTPPAAVIPALQAERVTAFTVAIGSGVSAGGQATLQSVANATGGRFFRVASAFDLVGLFLRLGFESLGDGLLTRAPVALSPGSVEQVPVLVEPGVTNGTFALTFENPLAVQSFTLVSPSGAVIDSTGGSVVEVVAETNLLAYRVSAPEQGTWTMVVAAGGAPSGQVEALAFASHPGTDLNVSVVDAEVVFPEPVAVLATPIFEGESVVGVSVGGVVIRPDGSEVPLDLFDDGAEEHGDAVSGDGIYSALFDEYNEDGTYTFELSVVSLGGSTYSGEDLFIDAGHPSSAHPVPDFVRLGATTAVISGVPDFVVGHVEIGPETVNLKSQGRYVTAYIELPDGFSPGAIDVSTVAITAVDGQPIPAIPAQSRPTELGDFDEDGVADLMVKFDRQRLESHLSPGMRSVRIEGQVAGQLFVAERSVAVIEPGNGP